MLLFRPLIGRASRAVTVDVQRAPDHALLWSDGFLDGTTEGESVDRALEARGLDATDFVRDGDLNRVDIAAGFRGPLTARSELGTQDFSLLPFLPRSTRSVQATAASRPDSHRDQAGPWPTHFTLALEDQGMHP